MPEEIREMQAHIEPSFRRNQWGILDLFLITSYFAVKNWQEGNSPPLSVWCIKMMVFC
ncbi:MAG: hypothetical protein ACFFCW_23180 [Candidatus Hodarchaeota archaeon]